MIKKCEICGKEYEALGAKLTCSVKCREKRRKMLRREKYIKKSTAGRHTLCWTCQNAVLGCSWSRSFTPVKGWTAIPTKIKYVADDVSDSYLVTDCPEYIPDNKPSSAQEETKKLFNKKYKRCKNGNTKR